MFRRYSRFTQMLRFLGFILFILGLLIVFGVLTSSEVYDPERSFFSLIGGLQMLIGFIVMIVRVEETQASSS